MTKPERTSAAYREALAQVHRLDPAVGSAISSHVDRLQRDVARGLVDRAALQRRIADASRIALENTAPGADTMLIVAPDGLPDAALDMQQIANDGWRLARRLTDSPLTDSAVGALLEAVEIEHGTAGAAAVFTAALTMLVHDLQPLVALMAAIRD